MSRNHGDVLETQHWSTSQELRNEISAYSRLPILGLWLDGFVLVERETPHYRISEEIPLTKPHGRP